MAGQRMDGGEAGDSPRRDPAQGERRGSVQAERDVNGRYRWSLKAPNGRIVAVSGSVHEDAVQAWQAFEELRGAVPGFVVRITHVRDGIGWVWMVPAPRGALAARSHRAYERYATCQNAYRRFVALLETPGAVQVPLSADEF
ncbi:DUF1508 domain-containing protein [Kitasatospora sp. NPDC096147]|uniref:DUF1508 domain-containing protein n=1 Tax=Kitasatospora sp. NPDC096147 TaxID=3364093 RepID=UPI0037F6B00B